MAIDLVRAPSDTPNISNIDDFVGLRYAYGNQRGYVKGKGSELGHSVSGLQFTVTSGRAVIDGAEVDIDANGASITANNTATKTYYTVYLKVNLNTNTATLTSANNTAAYPIISNGDDLTVNTIGTANLSLYTFDALSGTISNVNKVVSAIKYSTAQTNELKTAIENGSVVAKKASDYADTGTIKSKFDGIENGSVVAKKASDYTTTGTIYSELSDLSARMFKNVEAGKQNSANRNGLYFAQFTATYTYGAGDTFVRTLCIPIIIYTLFSDVNVVHTDNPTPTIQATFNVKFTSSLKMISISVVSFAGATSVTISNAKIYGVVAKG